MNNSYDSGNGATRYSSNDTISGGDLILASPSSTSEAQVHTSSYTVPVGGFVEASIDFPGTGTWQTYDWPAFWTSGPGWPAAGENDIAEGLGALTVNYHSPAGADNMGSPAGTYINGFHTYGLYRGAGYAEVFWDGKMVEDYTTHDNGQGETIILTQGPGQSIELSGPAADVKVDYVRSWQAP